MLQAIAGENIVGIVVALQIELRVLLVWKMSKRNYAFRDLISVVLCKLPANKSILADSIIPND